MSAGVRCMLPAPMVCVYVAIVCLEPTIFDVGLVFVACMCCFSCCFTCVGSVCFFGSLFYAAAF